VETKHQHEEYVGPSTHSIPDEKPSAKNPSEAKIVVFVQKAEDLTTPIVIQKEPTVGVQNLVEEPQI
jgi:hypothetical protein